MAPPPSPRKYWTRRGIAEWLADRLAEDVATIVGIDHGFSFPLRYFEVHQLEPDWPKFLEDFQRHWPTDAEHTYVDFVHDGLAGSGAARAGNTRWRRMTEQRAGSAKSVFHFDVQGSVAKSTHALPRSGCRPVQTGGRAGSIGTPDGAGSGRRQSQRRLPGCVTYQQDRRRAVGRHAHRRQRKDGPGRRIRCHQRRAACRHQ